MGKGSAKQEVVDYYMSIHYGICTSVDSIHGIYVGEKVAWEGSVSDPYPIAINQPNLFGGNKKEGGVAGTAYFLPGRPDQTIPESLAAKVGRTTATMPAYRGIASLWFTGTGVGGFSTVRLNNLGKIFTSMFGGGGFMWSSNNPYLRDIWMKVRRAPRGLGAAGSEMIGSQRSIYVDYDSVMLDGQRVNVTQGVQTSIGNHLVTLNRKSLRIDGTEIIVNLDADSNSDPKNRNPTVTVGGASAPLVNNMASVNGWTVNVTSSYLVSLGAGNISVANFHARQHARIDANPIHIIYECMTNPDWGMGGAPSSFDIPVWHAAAQTIFDEGFGMSLVWAKQTTIEAFVGEIVDHIQATIFINPRNGLWTIKLIRDDYDVDTLPVLNPDNCTVTSFERKAWGETTNEIVVTWTNPDNEEETAVSAQNLANITIQGAVISDSRNYYGIRNGELAMKVAKRDLRMSSTPLAILELEVDRNGWDLVPGGVVVLDYPEPDYNISRLVLRISKIDYGRPGDMTIKVNAVEDIFALPIAAYAPPASSEWLPTNETPRPFEFTKILTAPLYFIGNAIEGASINDAEFPDVMAMVLAAQSGDDTYSFDVLSEETDANGARVESNFGTFTTVGRAVLSQPLTQEVTSFAQFTSFAGEQGPAPNVFAIIGGGDTEAEFTLVTGFDEDRGFILNRAVLDTVPRNWAIGTSVWFVVPNSNVYDETERSGGESVTYKLLPRTSRGMLEPSQAAPITTTLTPRPWLPNRPGNVKVNGVAFGKVDLVGSASAQVTWATRNRLMEPTQVIRWNEGPITPELGQTTTVTLMSRDGVVTKTYSGVTGNSLTIYPADLGDYGTGIVRVTAERDGMQSLQGHEIEIIWGQTGWGYGWGEGDPEPTEQW